MHELRLIEGGVNGGAAGGVGLCPRVTFPMAFLPVTRSICSSVVSVSSFWAFVGPGH